MLHKIHAGGELASVPGADGILWDDPATSPTNRPTTRPAPRLLHLRRRGHWRAPGGRLASRRCSRTARSATTAPARTWTTGRRFRPAWPAARATTTSTSPMAPTTRQRARRPTTTAARPATVRHRPHQHHQGPRLDGQGREARARVQHRPHPSRSPANGKYFVKGEAPVVTIVFKDAENNNTPIDHTTVIQDTCFDSRNNPIACPTGGSPPKVASRPAARPETACSPAPRCSSTVRAHGASRC